MTHQSVSTLTGNESSCPCTPMVSVPAVQHRVVTGRSAPADSEPFLKAFEFTEFQRLISRFTTRHRRSWEKYSRSLSITNSLSRYGDGIFRTRCQTDGPGTQLVHPFAQDSLDTCHMPRSMLGARREWWLKQTWLLPEGCCRPGRETRPVSAVRPSSSPHGEPGQSSKPTHHRLFTD